MTFVVGSFAAREAPAEMYRGFPVDLFVLLAGVTYLFAVAERNGTLARIVEGSVRLARGRRRVIPWVVFAVAAAPAMAGAIGSAGVALLAPISMRLAERCALDRRLIGLMVVHGAAAGNFSPLNVLGAIVLQAAASRGVAVSAWHLFAGNVVYNVVLGAIIVAIFGRRQGDCAPRGRTARDARRRFERRRSDRRAAGLRARLHGAGARRGRGHLVGVRPQHRLRRVRRGRGAPTGLPAHDARRRASGGVAGRAARLRDRDLRQRAAAVRHGGRGRPRHSRPRHPARRRAPVVRGRRRDVRVRLERRHPRGARFRLPPR